MEHEPFERGGVDFFNIVVNGKSGVVDDAPERFRGEQLPSISIRQSGRTVHFDLPFQSTEASLYDFSGKLIYHTSIPQRFDRTFFVWDGSTRNGLTAAAGRYAVVWERDGFQYAQMFVVKR